MRYIYIDVLFIINLYVNHLMLMAMAKITHIKISVKRCLLASAIGALASFSVLLEPFGIILSLAYKLAVASAMCLICFGKRRIIKHTLLLFVLSMLFAGAALCISIIFPASNTIVSNSSVYFDISLAALFVFTSVAYLIICIIGYFVDKTSFRNGVYRVTVNTGFKSITLNGIADTGNLLVDSISGKPVIVCSKEDFGFDLSNIADAGKDINFRGLRYMPCKTIQGDSALPIFMPQSVEIFESNAKSMKKVEALIGLGENNGSAIFNPRLLL